MIKIITSDTWARTEKVGATVKKVMKKTKKKKFQMTICHIQDFHKIFYRIRNVITMI